MSVDTAVPAERVSEVDAATTKQQAKEQRKAEGLARKEILAPVNGALTVASLVMAVSSICGVVPFVLIVEACRELLAEQSDDDRVLRLFLIAVAVLVLRGLLQAFALTTSHLVDAGYQFTVRRALAAKLSRVPLGWFGVRSSSEVKSHLQDDVEALHYLVAHTRLEFVGALVVPLISLVYLVYVDWRLTLVLLIPVIGYLVSFGKMMDGPNRERLTRYTTAEQQVRDATVEFVDGISVVRAFGQAGRAHREFQHAVDRQADAMTGWKTPIIKLQAFSDVLVAPVFSLLVIVVAGLIGVDRGWIEPIDLLPFLLVGLGLGSSIMGLGYGGEALRAAAVGAQRLYELQQTPELARPETGTGTGSGTVRFADVAFGYRTDHRVLDGVSLELAPGTITALVGPSGSGKSTLAKLLPRFYDVEAGAITIGDRDIREFTSDELYRTVGFVFQDVQLIRGTIRENLHLARPDADDAALERAARAAQIHDRIVALPGGYDAVIGADVSLSGGEAQRLSIARALLADTPVLVLDEATAFADPESEAAVQDALATLVVGRTVLVIAHRLHTITEVDNIVVLEHGTVVEQGTHRELLAEGGTYRRLWDINEAALGDIEGEETR